MSLLHRNNALVLSLTTADLCRSRRGGVAFAG